MTKKLGVFFFFLSCLTVFSQEKLTQEEFEKLKEQIKEELKEEAKKSPFNLERFSLSGYGVVNYYNYGQFDTYPDLKDKIDAERLNLYLGYKFNDKISLKTEFEFEHGGTGSTMELDIDKEFGEYEHELEAGGEVKLEQVHLDFKIRPYFNVRLGRMKLHFNLAQNLDRPTEYFTTHRQEMENEILPLGWYENGVQFYGAFFKNFRYELSLTNGLDAAGFSSRNWIKGGHQIRFEMANFQTLAFTGRLDYLFGKNKNTFIGAGLYRNNTTPNRPKTDVIADGNVTALTGHISYNEKHLRFNSVFLWGNLQNSDIITRANSKLSGILGVKKTPVAKEIIGFSFEGGYEILHFFTPSIQQKLYPFIRYEYYDTMKETAGLVVRKPRFEKTAITSGVNWFITEQIVFKAHYQTKTLNDIFIDKTTSPPTNTGRKMKENTFSLGVAFSF